MSKRLATRMNQTLSAALALGFLCAAGGAQAQAITKEPTLKDLTEQADTILVASCTKKESFFRDGHIITHYTLKPTEVWKGSPRLNSAGESALEQIGGQLESPLPVGEHDFNSVHMVQGDQVLLFTQTPANAPTTSSVAGSPAPATSVVGGPYGLYSVVQDPETGSKLLAQGTATRRLSSENLKAQIAAQKEVAAQNAANKAANAKAAGAKTASAAQTAADAATADDIKPFEDFDAVRARVKKLTGQSPTVPAQAQSGGK